MVKVFASTDGSWGDAEGLVVTDISDEQIHSVVNSMNPDDRIREIASNRTATGKYEVTGMFDGGAVEVHEIGTDHYITLDINALMADKAALDAMVEIQRTAEGSDECDGYVFELGKRRGLKGI